MLDNPKQIFGWVMYDWANSAYVTTIVVAVLPAYFASVVVPSEGLKFAGTYYSATSIWGLMVSVSAFFVFLFAPILGAISDFSAAKKKFMMVFCYTGSLAAILLFFCGQGDILATIFLFIIAQIGFVAANIFYDAFLPQIASENKLDWISGKGFAFGYVGGGVQFAIALLLIAKHATFGLSAEFAARLAMLMAALWWGGFALITFFTLKEAPPTESLPAAYRRIPKWRAYTEIGILRTVATVRKVKKFNHLLRFLIAYLIYNNGIQTVMAMATIYGTQELGLSNAVLMGTLLAIQFISVAGALGFSKLAERVSTKTALIFTLVGWSIVVIYAYFLTSSVEYFVMGAIVGLVQGGSQSLSRSFYGSIVPVHASAEFYGFYSVFNKGSAIFGPLAFSAIGHFTGNARTAILSLIIFFIVGLILLFLVDVEKAKEAKNSIIFKRQAF